MKPIISYKHGGYDGANKPITSIYAELDTTGHKYHIIDIRTPGQGWVSSSQENELSEVRRKCEQLYPNGFVLPYYVDGGGYVRLENPISKVI